MKAIEVKQPGGLENLVVTDRPRPEPGPYDVLVRWRATSLNYHDLSVALGRIPTEDGRIPMSDGAGEVVAVGTGVTRWQVGDKVMSQFFPDWQDGLPTRHNTVRMAGDRIDGCAVEYAAVSEQSVTRIPTGYSYAEAATLPCAALTAWRALVPEGRLKAGDSVLVEGTGGMSVFALQVARAAGARVFATTSSSAKADRLKALGASAVVNYRDEPEWGERIREMSGGGVDCVLDVGGAGTLDQSLQASRVGGHVLCIGILAGHEAQVFIPRLFFNQQKISGIAVGSAAMLGDLVKAIEANEIRPVIDDARFPLDELAEAFRCQQSGEHFGKIVVDL